MVKELFKRIKFLKGLQYYEGFLQDFILRDGRDHSSFAVGHDKNASIVSPSQNYDAQNIISSYFISFLILESFIFHLTKFILHDHNKTRAYHNDMLSFILFLEILLTDVLLLRSTAAIRSTHNFFLAHKYSQLLATCSSLGMNSLSSGMYVTSLCYRFHVISWVSFIGVISGYFRSSQMLNCFFVLITTDNLDYSSLLTCFCFVICTSCSYLTIITGKSNTPKKTQNDQLLNILDYERSLDVEQYINLWRFDFKYYDKESLVTVSNGLLFSHKDILLCQKEVINNFSHAILSLYRDNPYHNALHAAQVSHSASLLVNQQFIKDEYVLSSSERLSLSIASICHDVGHPGLTNSFLIRTKSTLSYTYNDVSVLENFHAALTFNTILKHNILYGLSETQYSHVRFNIVQLILATDMIYHSDIVAQLVQQRTCQKIQPTNNILVLKAIIKAADLVHASLPWSTHYYWSLCLSEEFHLQGDREVSLGFLPPPDTDREKAAFLSHRQAGFINQLIQPLFKEIRHLGKNDRINDEIDFNLKNNVREWQAMVEGCSSGPVFD